VRGKGSHTHVSLSVLQLSIIESCLFLPVWAGISVECLLLSWFHAPCTVRRLSCLSQHIPVYKKPPLQHLIVEMTAKTEAITWRQGSAPLSFSILIQYSAPLYTDSTAALTFNVSIRKFSKIKYDSNRQADQSPLQTHNKRRVRISIDPEQENGSQRTE
jgi:hypothetical protein